MQDIQAHRGVREEGEDDRNGEMALILGEGRRLLRRHALDVFTECPLEPEDRILDEIAATLRDGHRPSHHLLQGLPVPT